MGKVKEPSACQEKTNKLTQTNHKDFFLEIESLYVHLISGNKGKIIDNYTLE
jgi:hypothetical protein